MDDRSGARLQEEAVENRDRKTFSHWEELFRVDSRDSVMAAIGQGAI